MTTSISKAVPRSRLNITYRTQIDGQVVRKELPLRLLIAGDFSGRAKELLEPGEHARPLPHLSQRIIYSIGKEGSLPSILSRSRISLPIPGPYATKRKFALHGEATVRVERNRDAEGKPSYQLWIKNSKVEQAVELRREPKDATKPEVALDSVLYSGELFSSKVFTIQAVPVPVAALPAVQPPAWPSVANEAATLGVESWRKKQTDVVSAFGKDNVWVSATGADLHGWLEPPVSPAGEPPSLFDLTGHGAQVWFKFESDVSLSFESDDRQSAEFRVRLAVTEVEGRSAIRLSDMSALSPERVARAVPQIRRLLVIRWLASQGRSMISSNPVLRNYVKSLLETQYRNQVRAYKPWQAVVDQHRATGKALLDPTTAAAASPTDPLGTELKALQAQGASADQKRLAELKQKVGSVGWAETLAGPKTATALSGWDAAVAEQKLIGAALADPTQAATAKPTDPEGLELQRLQAMTAASLSTAQQARLAELKAKVVTDAWAQSAAGPKPAWEELAKTVFDLKLSNFTIEGATP
jgi:predicted component of type VI protein secretion system